MLIQDRIKAISDVTDVHWDSRQNRLVVYYSDSIPKDTMAIRVCGAIGDAGLQRAIETITLISVGD